MSWEAQCCKCLCRKNLQTCLRGPYSRYVPVCVCVSVCVCVCVCVCSTVGVDGCGCVFGCRVIDDIILLCVYTRASCINAPKHTDTHTHAHILLCVLFSIVYHQFRLRASVKTCWLSRDRSRKKFVFNNLQGGNTGRLGWQLSSNSQPCTVTNVSYNDVCALNNYSKLLVTSTSSN